MSKRGVSPIDDESLCAIYAATLHAFDRTTWCALDAESQSIARVQLDTNVGGAICDATAYLTHDMTLEATRGA